MSQEDITKCCICKNDYPTRSSIGVKMCADCFEDLTTDVGFWESED